MPLAPQFLCHGVRNISDTELDGGAVLHQRSHVLPNLLIDSGIGGQFCRGDRPVGFHEGADRIVETAGIDYCLANRLEVQGGKLTGKLAAEIVTRERKLDALRSWAQELGLPLSQTVAMGDGANDIPMIQAAGTGIAFCAKPKTREAAPFAINERNLMLAMDIILRD